MGVVKTSWHLRMVGGAHFEVGDALLIDKFVWHKNCT